MSNVSKQGVSPLWVVGIYAALIVTMLLFIFGITIYADIANYRPDWMPKIIDGVLELIKILIGAIIGALTPAAVNRALKTEKNF